MSPEDDNEDIGSGLSDIEKRREPPEAVEPDREVVAREVEAPAT